MMLDFSRYSRMFVMTERIYKYSLVAIFLFPYFFILPFFYLAVFFIDPSK